MPSPVPRSRVQHWIAWTFRRLWRVRVSGRSMLPTLQPGQMVLVDRRAYALRCPSPGDVVLARDPRSAHRLVVKRVVAERAGTVRVRGDNQLESADVGPLPASLVLGRVVCTLP